MVTMWQIINLTKPKSSHNFHLLRLSLSSQNIIDEFLSVNDESMHSIKGIHDAA